MKFLKCLQVQILLLCLLCMLGTKAQALSARDVYKKVKNSIFTLYSYDYGSRKMKGRGTAVAVGKDILVTNCHVALSGNYLIVKVDDVRKNASLVYKNEQRDLCLLEVPNANFEPVQIRPSSQVEIGEVVYAIGNPRGTEKTLSKGIISNKHKVLGGIWLQTDAAIYYGSSGGGLFDEDGRLVGITAKMGGNFGFAIPTEWVLAAISPKVLSEAKERAKNAPSSPSDDAWRAKLQQPDYSRAHANLKLLGTYGQDKVQLYQNNNQCFVTIWGVDEQTKRVVSVTMWNPSYPKNIVVFSDTRTTKDALIELFKSIVERRQSGGKPKSFQSDNILYLGGHPYRLYGLLQDNKKYKFFVTKFTQDPESTLRRVKHFTVEFESTDGSGGKVTVIYNMDGFNTALSSHKKMCSNLQR